MHKLLERAARYAVKGNRKRKAWVGSVGLRRDGVVVYASNGSPGGVTVDRCPSAHAEAKLCRKLDWGATVYVARIRRDDGSLAMAKPCENCERLLRNKGVKKVLFTINENEYGVMEF